MITVDNNINENRREMKAKGTFVSPLGWYAWSVYFALRINRFSLARERDVKIFLMHITKSRISINTKPDEDEIFLVVR